MKNLLKKIHTSALVISILSTAIVPAYATNDTKYLDSNINYTQGLDDSFSEQIIDDEGNKVKIDVEKLSGDESFDVKVYVNDVLTQMSHVENNQIYYTSFEDESYMSYNTQDISKYDSVYSVEEFSTEFQQDSIDDSSIEYQQDTIGYIDDAEVESYSGGWTHYRNYSPLTWYSGTKSCSLYYKYVDKSPGNNRFSGRQIRITAGTPIAVGIGLFGMLLSGSPITPLAVIKILGGSIAGDVITNYVSGTVTYSTQRIRYRPMVGGREIFGDAYIDKLWLVIHDDLRQKDNYRLVNSSYRSNRGSSPDEIARNAQIAQAQGQY